MVRINKVYTRKGDSGKTSLIGGRAVAKHDPRVDSYGTVDELNSLMGIVRVYNDQKPASPRRDGFARLLVIIQQKLFDLGAELATLPGDEYEHQVTITAGDVLWLEGVIDTMNAELKPLKSFVLPGGGEVAAFLHQARAVCRRAERITVGLAETEATGAHVIPFLNRLSDALFVFSRWVTANLDEPETLWEPGLEPDDSWRW